MHLQAYWYYFFRGGSVMLATNDAQKYTAQKCIFKYGSETTFFSILNKRLCFVKILHTRPPHQRLIKQPLIRELGRAAVPLLHRFSHPLTIHACNVLHSVNNIIYTGTQKKKEKGSEQCPVLCCGASHCHQEEILHSRC